MQRPDEPVEVGDDDHLGRARLDEPERLSQTWPLLDRRASGDVQLLEGLDELESVALAGIGDTLALFGGGDERIAIAAAYPANPDDSDGTTRGGSLGS